MHETSRIGALVGASTCLTEKVERLCELHRSGHRMTAEDRKELRRLNDAVRFALMDPDNGDADYAERSR